MACAAILSVEDFRDTQRRAEMRQRLHDRLERDIVVIEIWDRQELSGRHIIGPDGQVTLPVVGPIRLTDLTREEERFRGTETPLWEHEVKRNRLHGAFLVGCPALALVSSLALSSSLPLVGLLVVSGGVMSRTVAKARWKSSDLRTLLLYSLHSHIQQVPILLGQLCYCHDRWLGRRRALIEYKELPS
jgi:hypothetical protein